jgi:hypothetical protein
MDFLCRDIEHCTSVLLWLKFHVVHGADEDEDYLQPIIQILLILSKARCLSPDNILLYPLGFNKKSYSVA